MSNTDYILCLIETLSALPDSDSENVSKEIEELNLWITTHLKKGSNDALFSVSELLSKDRRSFYSTFLKFNIDYRQIDGGRAFAFGIPIFFPYKVPYDLLSKIESAIPQECLREIMIPSFFPPGCTVAVLDFLSDISQSPPIKPSVLYSLSSYLFLAEKLYDEEVTEIDHSASPYDPATKGFRVLHDTDRCLLLGSAYWYSNETDFGLVPIESEQFKQAVASSSKNIARKISAILGVSCQVQGLMSLTSSLNEMNKGHFGY